MSTAYFGKVHDPVMQDPEVTAMGVAVYAAVARCLFEFGPRPPVKDLLAYARCARSTLYDWLGRLADLGHLEIAYGDDGRYESIRQPHDDGPGARAGGRAKSEGARPGGRQEPRGARPGGRPPIKRTFEQERTLTLGDRTGLETPPPAPLTVAPPPLPSPGREPEPAWDRPDPTPDELAAWRAAADTRAGRAATLMLNLWRDEQGRRAAVTAGVGLTPRMPLWTAPTVPRTAPRPSNVPSPVVETETLWRRLTSDGSDDAAEAVADRMIQRHRDPDWRRWYLRTAKRVQAGELPVKVPLQALYASRSATAGDPGRVFTGVVSAAVKRPAGWHADQSSHPTGSRETRPA